MTITSYRDLKVWQMSVDLAEAVYSLTQDFPKTEVYGLTAQMRRAAVSVPANIAEGHGRETTGAFIQFLRVAQGSLKELETHAIIAQRLDFMSAPAKDKLLGTCDELGKMVRGLIRSPQERQSES